jgi:acyl-CoA synthetase (AMP-forming)/AMP-acid ligase II
MMGYWKNQAASKNAITKGGWLMSGDVAVMDADGFFRRIARKAERNAPLPMRLPLIASAGSRHPLVPRLVVFVYEFPRSFIGKVLRRELARRYEQGQSK